MKRATGRATRDFAREREVILRGRKTAERLGLKVGDRFKIGAATLELRGTVTRTPDAALNGLAFGPRVTIPTAALAQTGLIQPGTLVNYDYRLRLPRGSGVSA